MCGRFTLRASAHEVAKAFQLELDFELTPRHNIAPTQQVAAIRFDPESAQRRIEFLHWGLVPAWADDPSIGSRMINARGETVAEKPSFRKAFKSRRCLVVADGYYEWRKIGAKKQPYHITLRNNGPFAFAGLWERWRGTKTLGGEPLESCAIITTSANAEMKSLHDRMPVILSPIDYSSWLDPTEADVEKLKSLLEPAPASELRVRPVSAIVNNPRNDSPECLAPLETSSDLEFE